MTVLESRLREQWAEDVPPQRIDAVWQGLSRRRSARKDLSSRPLVLFAAAAVAAAIALVLAFGSATTAAGSGPLRLATGGVPPALSVGAPGALTVLADGSRIETVRATELAPTQNDGSHFGLRLARGRATFDVVPGGPRAWIIDAGSVKVTVLGTKFTVDRSDQRVRVDVERGHVRVTTPAGERELKAGESLEIPLQHAAAPPETASAVVSGTVAAPLPEPASTLAASPPEPARSRPSAVPPDPRATASAAPLGEAWTSLAKAGKFNQAFDALGDDGFRAETGRSRSPDELLSLADVARLSGHPRDARAPLERVLRDYHSSRQAAIAAFTLGKIEADQLGDAPRAADAFEDALRIGLPAPLIEEAWARLAEARGRQGDSARAATAARRYLATYPGGRHEAAMKRWAAAAAPP